MAQIKMYDLFVTHAWRYHNETTPFSLHILNAIPPEFASSFAFTELPVDRHLVVHH